MTKLKTFSDIRNEISLDGFHCGPTGLRIVYSYGSDEHTIIANPEQAADLLKHTGIIEEYTGSGDDVAVECWVDGELTQMHWLNFVFAWDGLYEFDALRIAATTEDHKQINRWAANMRSIPGMVSKIANENGRASV